MSSKDAHDEAFISRMAYRPRSLTEGMIPITETSKFHRIQRASSCSKNGNLDRLPVELTHCVLQGLDLQSLSRLSSVSLRSKAIVEAFPPYRELIRHVPETLRALGKTRLARLHTADDLYSSLRSEQCISCKQFGPYLFLPTCERCCYNCLHWNPSLRVIPVSLAKTCFCLTQGQLKQMGIMRSITGRYGRPAYTQPRRRLQLVSVRMARKLALNVHGSVEELTKFRPSIDFSTAKDKAVQTWYTIKLFQEASAEPIDGDATMFPAKGKLGTDAYSGLASIHFPSLSNDGTHEKGLWCKGCQWTLKQYNGGPLPPSVALSPPNRSPFFTLLHAQSRARSRSEFAHHITQCYGAQSLKRVEPDEWGNY